MRAVVVAVVAGLLSGQASAQSVDGFYVGILGAGGAGPVVNTFNGPGSGTIPIDHGQFLPFGFAGYNFALEGSSVIGMEVSVSGDLSPDLIYGTREQRGPGAIAYPYSLGYSSSSSGFPGLPTSGSVTDTVPGGQSVSSYAYYEEFQEIASPIVSARWGHQFGDVLIYSRAGAGLSVLRQREVRDETRSVYCTETIRETTYTPTSVNRQATGCSEPYSGSLDVAEETTINPSVEFAAGVELGFGRFFSRAEVSARHIFTTTDLSAFSDDITTYRFGGGLGFRF